MGHYIGANGYYEGDKAELNDIEVQQRPNPYAIWQNGGWALDPAQQQAALTQAVQDFMDAAAKLKGYDSILSACSYAGAPNSFQAEGQSFLAWRAACWAYCYQVQAAVTAGTQSMPTAAQLIAGLPARI